MNSIISGVGGISPHLISGAGKKMGANNIIAQMFQSMDSSGAGSISKSQFQSAFDSLNLPSKVKSLGADAIFNRLDPTGTGNVGRQDFITGIKTLYKQSQEQNGSGFLSHLAAAGLSQIPGVGAASGLAYGLLSLKSAFSGERGSGQEQNGGSSVNIYA